MINELVKMRATLMKIGTEVQGIIGKYKGYYLSVDFKVCKDNFELTIREDTRYDAPEIIIVNIPFWFYEMYKDGKRRMFNWICTECRSHIEFYDNRRTIYTCDMCGMPSRITNEDRYGSQLTYRNEWRCDCCGEKIED